jgi:hypothetical protein
MAYSNYGVTPPENCQYQIGTFQNINTTVLNIRQTNNLHANYLSSTTPVNSIIIPVWHQLNGDGRLPGLSTAKTIWTCPYSGLYNIMMDVQLLPASETSVGTSVTLGVDIDGFVDHTGQATMNFADGSAHTNAKRYVNAQGVPNIPAGLLQNDTFSIALNMDVHQGQNFQFWYVSEISVATSAQASLHIALLAQTNLYDNLSQT